MKLYTVALYLLASLACFFAGVKCKISQTANNQALLHANHKILLNTEWQFMAMHAPFTFIPLPFQYYSNKPDALGSPLRSFPHSLSPARDLQKSITSLSCLSLNTPFHSPSLLMTITSEYLTPCQMP